MSKQENKDNKLRVYEYAKSLNMSSKEIITILKRLNVPVNNHMSVMENDTVSKVEQFFKDIKSNAAAKRDSGDASRTENRKPTVSGPMRLQLYPMQEQKALPLAEVQKATVMGRTVCVIQDREQQDNKVKASPKNNRKSR